MLGDLWLIFFWWLIIFVLSIIILPLTWLILKNFSDIGWGFAKILAISLVSYLTFLSAILKILPFSQFTIIFWLVLLIGINSWIFQKNINSIIKDIKEKRKILIFEEVLFAGGLTFWSYIRGFQPDINSLEKFMDYGFVNAILKGQYLPPLDMWMSGKTINYYWFGHFMTAVLTKLSGMPSEISYNLMIATIFGLTLVASFGLVSNLIIFSFPKKYISRKEIVLAYLGGLISATLLTLGGNLHTIAWHLIPFLQKCQHFYWYPDATRFIGYCPPTQDKTIHEFPIYSFVVADLHGHLLNLPLVILFIGLLWNFLLNRDKFFKSLPYLTPLSFVLSLMFMTNTWDFGIYLIVSFITVFLFNFKEYNLSIELLWETLKIETLVVVCGLVFALPFILNFSSIAQGVMFVHSRTPIWQLSILWGVPAIFSAIFLYYLYYSFKHKNVDSGQLYVLGLIITGWILIILPEIIFVKDIYIAEYHRANTMFKFTYQAFVIFSLCEGFIAIKTLSQAKRIASKFLIFLYITAFASVLTYPFYAIRSYYDLSSYKGLNGINWLKQSYPAELEAILWIRKNISSNSTILEAAGDSYTYYNLISSYSGIPTILGWQVHEWLWRGSYEEVGKRLSDVEKIYTSQSLSDTKILLEKYKVSYIIVGTLERKKYPNLNEEKIKKLGRPVFSYGQLTIYQI